MKRIKLILVCGLVLALTGLTTLVVAAGAQRDTKAIVRSVHGDVTYQADGAGPFLPLKVNTELHQKTVLKSGPGADAYLQVNGYTSTVKLGENTTVTLAVMTAMGPGSNADTSTDLKLDGGALLGMVKKLSANSEYRVVVPCGVAGVRGTDFQVTVTYQGNGNFTVVFTSVTGTIVCQVRLAPGVMGQDRQTLNTGESWTVTASGTTVLTVNQPQTLSASALAALNLAITTLGPLPTPPATTPPPPSPPTVTPPNTSGSQTGGSDNSGSGSGGGGGSGI